MFFFKSLSFFLVEELFSYYDSIRHTAFLLLLVTGAALLLAVTQLMLTRMFTRMIMHITLVLSICLNIGICVYYWITKYYCKHGII